MNIYIYIYIYIYITTSYYKNLFEKPCTNVLLKPELDQVFVLFNKS